MRLLAIVSATLVGVTTIAFAEDDETLKACIKQCSETCAESSGEDRQAYTKCMKQCLKDDCGIENPPDRLLIFG